MNFCGKTSPTTSDKIVQTLGSKSQFWASGKHFYLFPCLPRKLSWLHRSQHLYNIELVVGDIRELMRYFVEVSQFLLKFDSHWLHAGLGQYLEPHWPTKKKLYWIMKFSWCASTNCRDTQGEYKYLFSRPSPSKPGTKKGEKRWFVINQQTKFLILVYTNMKSYRIHFKFSLQQYDSY